MHYKEVAELGRGEFGTVVSVESRMDGMRYAIKHTGSPTMPEARKTMFWREVHAWAAVQSHANIVQYYDAWYEGDSGASERFYLKLELCGRSLQTRMATGAKRFSESELVSIMHQVAAGLSHMHRRGIAHMDIKPDNILESLQSPGTFKIGDVGLACRMDHSLGDQEGDVRYCPRELLQGRCKDLRKVDMFSLGATLYELARGAPLPKEGQHFQDIRDGRMHMLPAHTTSFVNTLKALLHPDPDRRPSAEDLLTLCSPTPEASLQAEVLQLQQYTQLLRKQLQQHNLPVPAANARPEAPPSGPQPSPHRADADDAGECGGGCERAATGTWSGVCEVLSQTVLQPSSQPASLTDAAPPDGCVSATARAPPGRLPHPAEDGAAKAGPAGASGCQEQTSSAVHGTACRITVLFSKKQRAAQLAVAAGGAAARRSGLNVSQNVAPSQPQPTSARMPGTDCSPPSERGASPCAAAPGPAVLAPAGKAQPRAARPWTLPHKPKALRNITSSVANRKPPAAKRGSSGNAATPLLHSCSNPSSAASTASHGSGRQGLLPLVPSKH